MDMLQETFEASRDEIDGLANAFVEIVPPRTSIRIVVAALCCVMNTCLEHGTPDAQSRGRAAIRRIFAEPGPMQ